MGYDPIELSDEEQEQQDEDHYAAAAEEEARQEAIQKAEQILGKYPGNDVKYRVSAEEVESLLKSGCLGSLATHKSIIELLQKHNELRATGVHGRDGNIILDGFDVTSEEKFSADTIRDFFEFAFSYSDDFLVSPKRLHVVRLRR